MPDALTLFTRKKYRPSGVTYMKYVIIWIHEFWINEVGNGRSSYASM